MSNPTSTQSKNNLVKSLRDHGASNLLPLRHSLSHILAMAVLELYPGTKLGIGPTIEDGFYYDFDFEKVILTPRLSRGKDLVDKKKNKISPEDLSKIENKMKQIIKQKVEFEKQEVSYQPVKKMFAEQPFKLELIEELKKNQQPITVYKSGNFYDLCAGPHIKSSQAIDLDGFKLTKIAGAYWRGDEKNKMLTRIYGTAFKSKNELKDYLKMLAEAEKRDHRKLGQELELFMIDQEVGAGLPLWLPKGAILHQQLEEFVLKEYQKRGYQLVMTPHIANEKLFKQSGHLDFYREGMYSPMDIEGENYFIKPMNCPFHIKIYQRTPKSYRDLPLRYTELGTVYRYERSGTLHGLTRVRGFTQDDAHIICTPEQLTDELVKVIELTKFILQTFGFDKFKVVLSVRDPQNKDKYLGKDKDWDLAENGLKKALEISQWNYEIEEGEAVFYGPKIDVKIFDAVGREWQISTLQLDFNLPEKFNISYTDKNGRKKRPFVLHRALLGSLERFMGVLIEHFAGAFPLWFSPIQIVIITVGSAHKEHAQKLTDELKAHNLRIELWDENETVGNKIRKAIVQKIPYMLVIGDKEMNSKNLHIRKRGGDKVIEIAKDKFIKNISKLIEQKSQEL